VGTVLASTIIGRAQTIFVDTGSTRWPTAECLDWLNAGQVEIATIASESFAQATVVPLIAGTKQSAPTGTILILRPVRNMGSDGATPGEPIRQVAQKTLDAFRMTWHTDAQNAVTKNFVYDPSVRGTFYVHPPAVAGQKIELMLVPTPTNVAASSNAITIDDMYQNVLLDYILYRGFSKDIEIPGTPQRAAAHRAAFENSLGLNQKTIGAVDQKEVQ